MGICVALLATHLLNLANLRFAERFAARRWRSRSPQGSTAPDVRPLHHKVTS